MFEQHGWCVTGHWINMETNKKKSIGVWQGIVLIAVIIFAVFLGIIQKINSETTINPVLNSETCGASGGVWNNDCECVTNEQCPFGFECGNINNGIGICLDL